MAWSNYEPPMFSHLSDDEFNARYFELAADIWSAFQSGEIGNAKREEFLKPMRDRMEALRAARKEQEEKEALEAAKREGLLIRRKVALRNAAKHIQAMQ